MSATFWNGCFTNHRITCHTISRSQRTRGIKHRLTLTIIHNITLTTHPGNQKTQRSATDDYMCFFKHRLTLTINHHIRLTTHLGIQKRRNVLQQMLLAVHSSFVATVTVINPKKSPITPKSRIVRLSVQECVYHVIHTLC